MFLKEGKRVSFPTVLLEALLCTLMIGAHEGRDVDIFDVPGAYLYEEIPKNKRILMNLRGNCFDILFQVNP